jgi:uncharacterized protein
MLIDEEWVKFFSENNFLVGISIDGPKDNHDANRIDANGSGSFNKVMKSVRLLDKYKVQYNVLCVVNNYVSRHASKVYQFFKKRGFEYLQFIPCLDSLDEQHGGNQYSLRPERFANFLVNLFDIWYLDILKGNRISIRYFDNLVGMYMGYRPEACGMTGQCENQFIVEANGDVYPCDFYVIDKWLLGNVNNMTFDELYNSESSKRFINQSVYVNLECKECKWFNICRGGCRRDREPFVEDKPGTNYYCSTFKEFFKYTEKRMQQLATMFNVKIHS